MSLRDQYFNQIKDDTSSVASSDSHEWEVFFSANTSFEKIVEFGKKYGRQTKHCVILTNLRKFREILHGEYSNFELALRMHCMSRLTDGWRCHLLDLSSNRLGSSDGDQWEECVNILCQGVDRLETEAKSKTEAVFIIGDDTIVPMALFENPCYDEIFLPVDPDVDSDLPFSTFSIEDPFIEPAALEMKVSVGRLPSGQMDRGAIALNYFKQSEHLRSSPSRTSRGFGVTAEVWNGASQEVASQIGDLKLFSSPDVTHSDFPTVLDEQSNYFYFNVHGSDMDKRWFGEGQSVGCIPVASPEHFIRPVASNALVTEACYGARFIGYDSPESSLRNSMLNKTIAFCGSSRIAYGPVDPPVGLADLIALHFLSLTKSGETFGEAFLKARQSLLKSDILTPHDQLTIVEFNLFADPTLTLPAHDHPSAKANLITGNPGFGERKSVRSVRDPLSSVRSSLSRGSSSLRVRMPDVLGDVRASLDATWEKIRGRMIDHIYLSEPSLQGQEPSLKLMKLGLGNKETLQISLLKKHSDFFIGRTIYADRFGKILREISPK